MIEALTGLFTPGNDALIWWLAVQFIGIAAFPIGFVFFRFLPDRGYAFSKILGLLLMTYLLWIGAMAHVIPNARWSIILILALIAATSAVIAFRERRKIAEFLRSRWSYVVLVEGLFTSIFLTGLYLRSYFPAISGFDKPFDFAFVNGVIRSDYFPARDPYLSGHDNLYYIFGHTEIASLTKLTGISSSITFNLGGVLLLALAATAVFGLVYNLVATSGHLKRAMAFGLVGALFLAALSNFIGLFELLAANDVGSDSLYRALDLFRFREEIPAGSSTWYPTDAWWILHASNFAYGGPDRQFPFFNFLRGDLHSQMLSAPFFVMAAAVAFNLWLSKQPLSGRFAIRNLPLFLLAALSAGAVGFTNLLDLPTVLFLLALVVLVRNYVVTGRMWTRALRDSLQFLVPLVSLSLLLFLPFYLGLTAVPSSGLELVEVVHRSSLVAREAVVTSPHHLLYMWLPVLWLGGSILVVLLARHRWANLGRVAWAVAIGSIPLFLWMLLLLLLRGPVGFAEEVFARGDAWVTLGLLLALLVALLLALGREVWEWREEGQRDGTVMALLIVGVAILLLVGMELFWVGDRHFPFRLNTVFHLGYQVWTLLAIGGAFALYYVTAHWVPRGVPAILGRISWGTITLVVILAALAYVPPALFWRTGDFDASRSLDGSSLSKRFNRTEYDAVVWLWDNVDGTPVILEAVGGSYSSFGRISSATGLPTVLASPTIEFNLRGSDPLDGRQEAVERAYTISDPGEARAILDQFDVEYVFVGRLEREAYGEGGLSKFEAFMDVVFENEDVTIYRMPEDRPRVAGQPTRDD